MSKFAEAVRPHLETQGIEGPEDLAQRLRNMGVEVEDREVEGWLVGGTGEMDMGHLWGIRLVLSLGQEEADEVFDAAWHDVRVQLRKWDERTE